ncbi:maleylpyruvate isomerase family mycothiol-dependent enzyme [Mycolicibacterium neoaurum]|uniref:Actinobacterial protein n=1 Tax=Mycolicibacterium neoaurum TaxID=1795 RepID=A0AAV2WGR0_MYCNE|nr:maleylpyruvate isomerase family mycothiol-dependent enzyme [Mycolicibacterium neoaurum]QVI27893.1 maleylpyruvate isomerase family mycothiol-dependent enzyme [Mycolicibacterium neoaurum]TLH49781.1 maleylpyruvate isomerase family mycothiol-dependent enzyme [Mycolicibacterium neoaurum]CDQ43391.1 putative Actinobacterial protein [Mycolicibacterium neoaurum]SDD15522.1 TIGR03083 family protein [Mycolicibacterium neoaurum]
MDFRAALLEQTRDFGELIRDADPATPVPTCGEWTLKQLFRHVGRGNRWCTQIITDRRTEALDPREVRNGKPPEDLDAAIDWLNEGAQGLVDAVEQAGSNIKVWTFGGPHIPGWWIRRRVHEQTVHRADALLALGREFDLPPDLAADGVSEWLDLSVAQYKPIARGQSLHLHATDDGLGPTGEWSVVHDEEGLSWTYAHGKSDVAVRGRAVDLLLAITRRRTAAEAGVEVLGDAEVWDAWLAGTPF